MDGDVDMTADDQEYETHMKKWLENKTESHYPHTSVSKSQLS